MLHNNAYVATTINGKTSSTIKQVPNIANSKREKTAYAAAALNKVPKLEEFLKE